MKATVRDTETLRSIRPLEIAAYLRVKGWRETVKSDKASYWTQQSLEGEMEILLPLRREFSDYALRISELLNTLELSESRSQLEILEDLNTANADVVRVRMPHDIDNGSILIENGVLGFQNVRDMVLAAACAAVARRSLYPPRKPNRALSYMKKLRMGQTERGSYVITLISPVTPVLQSDGERETRYEIEEPFEREAVRTLAMALEATRHAAERSAATGNIEPFSEAVDYGVSANLCEALTGLNESSGNNGVDISFSWSRSRPAPINTPQRIFLPEDTMPFITEAARVFRETTPLEDVAVSGVIIQLTRGERSETGKIVILGFVEDTPRRVTVELPVELYEKAIEAHQHQAPVVCFGDLKKEGNSFVLRNPHGFDFL